MRPRSGGVAEVVLGGITGAVTGNSGFFLGGLKGAFTWLLAGASIGGVIGALVERKPRPKVLESGVVSRLVDRTEAGDPRYWTGRTCGHE